MHFSSDGSDEHDMHLAEQKCSEWYEGCVS